MSGECEKCGHHCMDCDCKGEAMTDNNSAPELLPCPYCGAKNPKVHLVEMTGEVHSVECKTCFAECDDIASWNTRAPADLCAADRGVTVNAGSITGDRSEIDRFVKLLRTGKFGADVTNDAADLIEALAESEFNAHLAALQPTEAQPVVKRICPNCDGYGDIRCEQCRGQSYVAATPSTDNTALVEAAREALAELANVNMHLPLRDWQRISTTILAALASREAPQAVTKTDEQIVAEAAQVFAERIGAVIRLGELIGKQKPIIGKHWASSRHREAFAEMSRALGGSN